MIQEIFKRYEKKYLLTPAQYGSLMERLEGRVVPDEYGEYTICNVYFDTPEFDLIRMSLEKPVYKEKLRLRSYGEIQNAETVFVELKKKYDGVVYKRRAAMTLRQAEEYLYRGIRPEIDSQIMRELNWFTSHYCLIPAVYLAYDRKAFAGKEEDIRITFDSNIRGREKDLYLGSGSAGQILLPERKILMEVKIPDRMPLWMSRVFSEIGIFPVSFSKYGSYFSRNADALMKKELLKKGETRNAG